MKRIILLAIFFLLSVHYAFGSVINIPADYASIQAAIDNASSGDLINISAGVYNERLVIGKQLTIMGPEDLSAIIQPTNAPSPGVYDVEINASGTVIENILFDFNGVGDTRCGTGIVVSDLNEPAVTNVKIINNTIYTGDASAEAFICGQGVQTGKNSDVSGLLISGNTFFGDDNGMGEGIYVNPYAGAGDVTIENNGFYGFLFSGVSIETSNVNVIDNIFDSNTSQGIYGVRYIDLNSTESLDFPNNYHSVLISENNIQNFQYGIRVGTNSDVGSNLRATIELNVLTDNDVGIWARYGARLDIAGSVDHNIIAGNLNYGINNSGVEIVDARENYWGSCDGPSGEGPGSGDSVSTNVDYDPWLGICIGNKTNVSCAFENDNIMLSADLTGEEINSVWFSYTINGVNYNKTASIGAGNSYTYTIPSSELVGGANVVWNVYANDSLNVFNNLWKTFYVRSSTALDVDPASPDGLNGWYITEPEFSLIKDVIGGDVYYRWDSAFDILYTAPFGLEDIPNPPVESAGVLDLNWWTDFGGCGNESELNKTFHIDLKNPIFEDLEPANNSVVYNNHRPHISAYLDEV